MPRKNLRFPTNLHFKPLGSLALLFGLFVIAVPAWAQRPQPQSIAIVTYGPEPPSMNSKAALAPDSDPTAPIAGAGVPSLTEASPIERRAFEKANSVRRDNRLAALAWDPELCRMARAHSERMARAGFFSHVTPDGATLKARAHAMGIARFRVIAENIAYNQGYEDPGAFAVKRWMLSPGHRENLLNREFDASGIGVFVNSEGSVYLTQIFILR